MRLIPNWRRAGRFYSVRLNLLGLLLLAAEAALPLWLQVPPEARAALPRWAFTGLPLACFAGALVARVIRQRKLEQAHSSPPAQGPSGHSSPRAQGPSAHD